MRINRPSSPRWELDVIAYKPAQNELLIVECKSYLDSPGVRASGFDRRNSQGIDRFKLFNEPILRETVFNRLLIQLKTTGLCVADPMVTLCLACGNFATPKDQEIVREHFEKMGWQLFEPVWIVDRLKAISKSGYENAMAAIVTKLLLREK